jgi:hypothetical protein
MRGCDAQPYHKMPSRDEGHIRMSAMLSEKGHAHSSMSDYLTLSRPSLYALFV